MTQTQTTGSPGQNPQPPPTFVPYSELEAQVDHLPPWMQNYDFTYREYELYFREWQRQKLGLPNRLDQLKTPPPLTAEHYQQRATARQKWGEMLTRARQSKSDALRRDIIRRGRTKTEQWVNQYQRSLLLGQLTATALMAFTAYMLARQRKRIGDQDPIDSTEPYELLCQDPFSHTDAFNVTLWGNGLSWTTGPGLGPDYTPGIELKWAPNRTPGWGAFAIRIAFDTPLRRFLYTQFQVSTIGSDQLSTIGFSTRFDAYDIQMRAWSRVDIAQWGFPIIVGTRQGSKNFPDVRFIPWPELRFSTVSLLLDLYDLSWKALTWFENDINVDTLPFTIDTGHGATQPYLHIGLQSSQTGALTARLGGLYIATFGDLIYQHPTLPSGQPTEAKRPVTLKP